MKSRRSDKEINKLIENGKIIDEIIKQNERIDDNLKFQL